MRVAKPALLLLLTLPAALPARSPKPMMPEDLFRRNVGTESLASFLIVTPEGNILINSAYEAAVPVIRDSVEKLGFRFSDTKILPGSHAHADHMEGDAMVKKLTGAKLMATSEDPGYQLVNNNDITQIADEYPFKAFTLRRAEQLKAQ